MMKRYIVIFLLLSFFTAIAAESKESVLDSVENENPYNIKNWSILISFGNGKSQINVDSSSGFGAENSSLLPYLLMSSSNSNNSNTSGSSFDIGTLLLLSSMSSGSGKYVGQAYENHFKAEYRPNHFGFQFGMSAGVYKMKEQVNLALTVLPFMLMSGSGNYTSLYTLLLLPEVSSPISMDLSMTTFDFAQTIHAFPKSFIDPYMAVGVGVGICGPDCTAAKGFGKLGFNINIEGGYLFFEGHKQKAFIKPGGYAEIPPIEETIAMFGLGLYL